MFDGDLNVVMLDANLSLAVVVRQFLDNVVKREMTALPSGTSNPNVIKSIKNRILGEKKIIKDQRGYWRQIETGGGVSGALQVLYDADTHYIHMVGNSYSPYVKANNNEGQVQNEIMSGIVRWVADKFDTSPSHLSLVSGPIPFKDYEVHTLEEFPGVHDIARRMDLNIDFEKAPQVLLLDYSNHNIVNMVEEQFGSDKDSFFSDSYPFRYVDDNGKEIVRVNPPFILVNSYGKNVPTILRNVLDIMIDMKYRINLHRNPDGEGREKSKLELLHDKIRVKMDIGDELGDVMFQFVRNNLDLPYDHMPQTDLFTDRISSMGLEDSPQMRNFASIFMIFRTMYSPRKNSNLFNKVYYYTAISNPGDEIQHRQLFDQLFSISKSAIVDDQKHEVLASYYSFPPEAVELFGFETVPDQKVFDTSNRHLTTSPYYFTDGDGSTDQSDAMVADVVSKSYGAYHDNTNTPGMVRTLSSFPVVYSEIMNMFESRGVQYKDINVILIYDPDNPNMVGGYYKDVTGAEEALSKYGNYKPPIIVLNIYSKSLQSMDKVAEVLIHEASHYADDLMVMQGLADPSIMFNPKPSDNTLDDMLRYMRQYLSESPTEFNAHAMMPYLSLSMADAEYLKRNRFPLKAKLLKSLFIDTDSIETPTIEDAVAGSVEIKIDPSMISKLSDAISISTSLGTRDRFFQSGVNDFESFAVTSSDPSTGVVQISAPLSKDYPAGSGVSSPAIESLELRGEREVLYSKIIDHGFDMAIETAKKNSSSI